MIESVIKKIGKNSIRLVKVPTNMTKLIQPLDLTVNGVTKAFWKRKITEWYSCCISA